MKNYHGNSHPFLCAVFCHEDLKSAEPVLEYISGKGYRFCASLKTGIIAKSAAILLFLSCNSEKDKELTGAITAASGMKKPIITVFLENTELSPGFSLLLGSTQGIMKHRCADDTEFYDKLSASPVLSGMSVTKEQKRASKLCIASICGVAVLLAAALVIINPFSGYTGIAPDSSLGKLGLSGDPLNISEVYVYGEELRDKYYITAETDADNENPEVLFVDSRETAPYGSLSDISDFAQLKNLESLCVTGNSINDITPLYGLRKLVLLDISKNSSIDISGIGALSELETLSIAFNDVTGTNALVSLTALKTLYVSQSQRSMIEDLGNVAFEIIYIDEPQAPVTEPVVTEPPVTEPAVTEPVVTEPAVTEPPVTEPPVTEPPVTEPPVTEPPVTEPPVTEEIPPQTETISPDSILGKLGLSGETEKITELYVHGDRLEAGFRPANALRVPFNNCDVAFLNSDDCYCTTDHPGIDIEAAALINLEKLSLAGVGIDNLSALSVLTKLTLLDISNNPSFAGLSAIENLPYLETLNIAYSDIEDYSAIVNMKALKTLYVDETQYRRSKEFFDGLKINVISVDACVSSYEELKAELAGNAHFRIFIVGSIVIPEGETLVINGKAGVFLWGEWEETTLTNNGTLEIYGEYLWCQNVRLENNGTLILRGGSNVAMGQTEVNNSGTVIVEKSALLPVIFGSRFNMNGGDLTIDGSMEVRDGGRFIWNNGNITNNGTINVILTEYVAFDLSEGEKSDGVFVNNGTMNIENGTAEE